MTIIVIYYQFTVDRFVRTGCICALIRTRKNLPEEAVDIFEPLGYEVVGDGLRVVWKA